VRFLRLDITVRKVISITVLLTCFILIGCVGTVEESTPDLTNVQEAPKTVLTFAGLNSIKAISDSRIEVFFYPATGGSGKYTYDIQVGSSPFPISIPSTVLVPDYRGMLRTTITGLSRLTTYQIRVEVRDGESTLQSNSQVIKTTSTFNNLVADFNGISSAFNTSGQDGKDSIKIRWTPARSSGGLTKQEWDPKSYEVILIDSERLSPNDMDISYTPAEGRWVFSFNHDVTINEYIVRGLPAKTKFYVRMRAIHENSIDDVYDQKKRSELNTSYVTISTLSGSLADIDFQNESFSVALAAGEQGLSAIQASWEPAIGVFDHYQIYYSLTGGGVAFGSLPSLCLSPMLSPPGETVFCKKVLFSAGTTPITGLTPYTEYELALVLCSTNTCGPSERIVSPVRTIITDPTLPAFNGVKEILMARSLDEMSKLYIQYDIPNFSAGYFDGLILKMRRTIDGSDSPVEITQTTNPIYIMSFNFLTENQVVVRDVNYLDIQPYCFTLYPFKWSSDGLSRREHPNDIWKCVQPKPEAPTIDQFLGLSGGLTENNAISISWDTPSGGIFSEYEVFWRKQAGASFNWGDAIAQAGENFDYTNYGRMLVNSGTNQVTIDGFLNGQYMLGVLTHYTYMTDSGPVTIRSETNIKFKKCTVDDTLIGVVVDCLD
jgi:hypothetical protein